MPKRDGTGPYGNGPMSGKGDGICIIPLDESPQEIKFLKSRERALQQQLQFTRDRIKLILSKGKKKEAAK